MEASRTVPRGGSAARTGGLIRALGGPRRELLVGGALAIVSMLVIGRLARDFWFRYDNFFLLADRDFGSLNDWFRPHAGHWLTWTVLLSRGLYGLFGVDYWPWWYLPRLIGHAGLAFLLWRILLHRGADRLIAAGAYAALLVLAVSYFHDGLTVANYFVFAGLGIAALLLHEVEAPTPGHLLAMGTCLLAALMGNGYGVAVLFSVTLVAAGNHRFRRWAPALLTPGVIYATWYLWYRSGFPEDRAPLRPRTAIDAIEPSLVVLRTAVENTFGLPGALAAFVLALIGATLVRWLLRRRLDTFDAVMALTLAFTLVILALVRTVPRPGTATEGRYGYAVVLLLTLLVVPHLRAPSRPVGRVALALVLVTVIVFNAVSLHHRLDEREVIGQAIRDDAETTAALIADGEPYVSYARIGNGVQPRLIQRLVDGGWHPPPSTDPTVVARVRGRMRFATRSVERSDALGIDPGVAPAAAGVDDNGCLQLTAPTVVNLRVTGEGSIIVDGLISITWTDRFGTVRRTIGNALVGLAQPLGETEVTAEAVRDDPATICALTPIEPAPPDN